MVTRLEVLNLAAAAVLSWFVHHATGLSIPELIVLIAP